MSSPTARVRSIPTYFFKGSLVDPRMRASNEGWFVWSISSTWFVWLVGPEIHPEEPDRPANQTNEPVREHRRSSASLPSASRGTSQNVDAEVFFLL